MQKPPGYTRRRRDSTGHSGQVIKSLTIEPEAMAVGVFDTVIIAGQVAAIFAGWGGVAPPFRGDAFRPFSVYDLVQQTPPAKHHWRTVRHFGHGVDDLWLGKQT